MARRTRYTSAGVRSVRTVARLERTAWMMSPFRMCSLALPTASRNSPRALRTRVSPRHRRRPGLRILPAARGGFHELPRWPRAPAHRRRRDPPCTDRTVSDDEDRVPDVVEDHEPGREEEHRVGVVCQRPVPTYLFKVSDVVVSDVTDRSPESLGSPGAGRYRISFRIPSSASSGSPMAERCAYPPLPDRYPFRVGAKQEVWIETDETSTGPLLPPFDALQEEVVGRDLAEIFR